MFATLLKKRTIVFFIIAFLTSTLLATCFTPNIAASPVAINPISPSSGYVGESRQVVGTIDTASGAYRILFDGNLVANGTASSQKAVSATFSIQHCYKGNHTVTLQDVNTTNSASTYFTVNTKYSIKAIMPSQQTQLMEGQSTTIGVNVTGGEENASLRANITVRLPYPLNNTVYYNSLQLVNTTHPGEYAADSIYPGDFGLGAHTNYVGTYKIAFNNTLATGSFNVGLTNATQYSRFGNVAIQGANYVQPSERAWINITFAGKTVFSTNVLAIGGVVNVNWAIPWNATYGTYNVTVTSSTSPGTIKPIRDTQIFSVTKTTFPCQIHIKNMDNESVSGVTVRAYNGTLIVSSATSDNLGFARFSLETYTYSFKAFLKGVQIGNISALSIGGNVTQILVCQLANIKVSIKDEAENPLPFIVVDLKYNYTTAAGTKLSDTRTFETNSTGIASFQNTFINISYVIEAKRYDHIFNRTSIGNLTASQWVNITCPTYTLFIHVVNSQELPLLGISVNVTEWGSELLMGNKSWLTDNWGSVSLNLTFGRYRLKVYNYSAELNRLVVLNESIIDLTENRQFEKIRCKIVSLSPSILIVDYFGQPISNAEIKIERFSEIKHEWVEITPSRRTNSNGVASLPSIGGDYSISIYMLGQLGSIEPLYIYTTNMFVFKMDKYTVIGGIVIETSQLVVYIVLGSLIILLGVVFTYKRILRKITKK